jgi:outer membrane protein assembly factor BamB
MNQTTRMIRTVVTIGMTTLAVAGAAVADWPMWGGSPSRNMVSGETNIPTEWAAGSLKSGTDHVDMATTKNVLWVAKMGSQTYGNPVVANGRVYVGTNNDGRDDDRFKGDYSLLKCLDEKTGQVLWTLTVPKLGAGKVSDWEYLGICSSPSVDGDRVYVVTNRCDVLCLDVKGMSDGNQGYADEGRYMANEGTEAAVEVREGDADILWKYDMLSDLGIFPHNITSSAPLIVGDLVYVATSNGVDWSHTNIPSPKAPTLVALNKLTGELAGEEASGISRRILHGGWSSPAFATINGKPQIIFGAPDGMLYGFEATPRPDAEGYNILHEVWRFDANPPHYRFKNGDPTKPIKYARPEGPSEFIATPVVHQNRVYAAIGQDPEHGEGVGNLVCVDAGHTGDVTTTARIWNHDQINRSISTVAIVDDLLFIADFSGFVYCFDARTGSKLWEHDSLSHIWGSPLAVDGKVYVGNEDGDVLIFAVSREKQLINTVNMGDPVHASPVVANGKIFIPTMTQLYCIGTTQTPAGK